MTLLGRQPLACAVLAACALLTLMPRARASGPPPPPPTHEAYEKAAVVLLGEVASVGPKSMEVRPLEVLKGTPVANTAGTLTVGPIFEAECCVRPEAERTPIYRAGDRILVAAVRAGDAYVVYGDRYGSQDLGDDAAVAKAVALAREVVRIVGLPEVSARRAAMVALLVSPDPASARVAEDYQVDELDEPAKSRPHAAGLAAALRAPRLQTRRAALRALRGVAAPEAFERIVELSVDADAGTAGDAAEALAGYARDDAVQAIERAAAVPGRRALLAHLASSPQPLAHRRLHERIASGKVADRALAYVTLGERIKKVGATEEDVAVLLVFVRSDAAAAVETYQLAGALTATDSVVVARAMLELVRDPAFSSDRRHVAYWVLNVWVRVLPAVLELARKDEALLVARLDEGDPQQSLVEVLGRIHTRSARAALEHAAASHPDPDTRKAAARTLEAW